MKRFFSLPATFLAFWALAFLFLCSPASAQSAGQGTRGLDDFLAETTGNIVCEDFDSLINIDGNPAQPAILPENEFLFPTQSTSLGQLSFPDIFIVNEAQQDGSTIISFASPLDDPQPLVLELDPDLGKLEGFFVETGFLRISLFDGDTLLDNFPGVTAADDVNDPNITLIGWINTQGLNVTRVEFNAPDPEDLSDSMTLARAGGLIGTFKASFLPCPEPPVSDPDLLIPMLIDDIEDLIDSNDIGQGQGNPIQNFLNQALKDINKGKTDKAIDKLIDASERVLALINDGSLSAEQGQEIIDMIDLLIIDLLEL